MENILNCYGIMSSSFRDVVTKRIIKLSWRLGFPSPFLTGDRHVEFRGEGILHTGKGVSGIRGRVGNFAACIQSGNGWSVEITSRNFFDGCEGVGIYGTKLSGRAFLVFKNKILNINGLVV